MTSERREGPTPNGGVASVAYYTDESGVLVDKSRASRVEIVELDATGNEIHRTYGAFKGVRSDSR